MAPTINEYIKTKKALVVEDEAAIAQLIKMTLDQMGFEVSVAHSAEAAFVRLQTGNYALCLLDWMLPGVQGVDFLKQARPQHKNLKIMMVTARVDSDSIVMALESGADDYLPKPFDPKVLTARVRNLMRRSQTDELMPAVEKGAEEAFPDQITFDSLTVHFTKHIVRHQNVDVHLTPSEFKLLAALIKARGQVLTRDQLIDSIQGEDVAVTGRTIDTHIFALRKKIGAWSKHIETIRGVGYRILISETDATEPEAT